MAGNRRTVRSTAPAYKVRTTARRRRRRTSQPRPLGPLGEAVVAGLSLMLAVLGSLFVAARLAPLSVPPAIGYGAAMGLLGGAGMFTARRPWSRIALGVSLLIAFGLGAAWLS